MKYNPFNPNSVVSTNLFAGRTEYVLHIIRKLENVKRGMPSSFFLYGERGIGKTALAKLIKHISMVKDEELGKLSFISSYYSAEKGQSITSVLQASLNELTDQIPRSSIKILGEKLGKLFEKGKFSIGAFSMELEKSKKREESVILRDQLISILSNVIDSIKLSTEGVESKDGVLIIIDEMGNIKDIGRCAQLLRGIITTLDVKELGFISFLLIGYDTTLNKFFNGDPSARRYVDSIRLGVMPMTEAKEVLVKGFKEAEVKWDDESLNEYISVTGGYPHSIQLIGHYLLEEDKDDYINDYDWNQAIGKTAIELQRKDFAALYNFNSKPGGREAILDVLAVVGKPLSKKEIQSYCNISNIYQYLPELKKRGSIKIIPETDNITLHSQLFRTSILLKIYPKIISKGYLKDLFEEASRKTKSEN
jgi:hypothetical protein